MAAKRVMDAYSLLVRPSIEEEPAARQKLLAFLTASKLTDETRLAVEGIKFLRSRRERA
jgi:hypothetical protein